MFISLQNKEDILIQVEDYQTHVVCNADDDDDREHLRTKIRDALIACLNKFWRININVLWNISGFLFYCCVYPFNPVVLNLFCSVDP